MGYFNFGVLNFCYRLWRSKKFRKFVIGFGFLAFVLSTIISNTTFAAQSDAEYTTDTTINILESYQRNVDIFVRSFNQNYGKNDLSTSRFNLLFNLLTSSNNTFNYLYLRHYSIDNDNLNLLVYSRDFYNLSSQVTTNWSPDGPNATNNLVPTTGYNVSFSRNFNISITSLNIGGLSTVDVTDFVPSVLMFRMPSEIVDCMEKAGYTYAGPIVDIKQQIADIKETMTDIQEDLERTERTPEEQAEQEQTMQDLDSSVTSSAETSEYNSLITSFNDYYDRLSSAVEYNENVSYVIRLPIPFVTHNKVVVFPADYIDYHIGSVEFGPFGTIKNFIQTIWFVVFGTLIGRLIWRIVSYFTSGEFLNDEGYKTFRSILSANMDSINPLML